MSVNFNKEIEHRLSREPPLIYYQQKLRQLQNHWLKVIIRAISDYVLYRKSTKPKDRREADTARSFLFDEGSGLDGICETFNLNIEVIQHLARTKTPSEIHKIEHLEYRRIRTPVEEGSEEGSEEDEDDGYSFGY